MDDASLAELVNTSARAVRAIWPVERRWTYLGRLHARVIRDLRARRLDRDLATVHADMVIEAIIESLGDGPLRRRTPANVTPGLPPRGWRLSVSHRRSGATVGGEDAA